MQSAKNSYILFAQKKPLSIQATQEHWLLPPFKKQAGVNKLRSLHPDFDGFGTSAMKTSMESSVRRGRPYGSTGFIYPKKCSHITKPLVKYSHERVSVIELACDNQGIIIINLYLPFLDKSDIENVLRNYNEVLGFAEYVMEENSDAEFVILMDFNCNLYDPKHPFFDSLTDFINSHFLTSVYDLSANFRPQSVYSRFDSKSKSLLDYIFVSKNLCHCINDVHIMNYPDNTSDHLPVEVDLTLKFKSDSAHKKHQIQRILFSQN